MIYKLHWHKKFQSLENSLFSKSTIPISAEMSKNLAHLVFNCTVTNNA